MKKLIPCLALLAISVTFSCAQAPFASLIETDVKSPPNNLDPHVTQHYIDISSSVDITIDKNAIVAGVANQSGNSTQQIQSSLDEIQGLLNIAKDGLDKIKKSNQNLKPLVWTSGQSQQVFIQAFNQRYKPISKLADTINDYIINAYNPSLFDIFNQLSSQIQLSTSVTSPFETSFNTIIEYTALLRDSLQFCLDRDGIRIQMAATLNPATGHISNIHLPGFDDFTPPAAYDPYAFKLALSDAQQKQLADMQKTADDINKNGGLSGIFKTYKQDFKTLIAPDILKQCAQNIIDTLTNGADLQALKNKVLSDLTPLQTTIGQTITAVTKFSKDAKDAANLLNNGGTDVSKVQSDILNQGMILATDINGVVGLIKTLNSEVANLQANPPAWNPALVTAALQQIKNGVTSCDLGPLGTQLMKIPDQINTLVSLNKPIEAISQFPSEVRKISLTQLPLQTTMDLARNGGIRDHGDIVQLEIRAVRKDGTTIQFPIHRFILLKTQVNFDMQVGLMFVNDSKKADTTRGKFFAAPSVTIFLKFPTGKDPSAYIYRKYFDVGLGLNIATFNFSHEGKVEVGLGGVISCFSIGPWYRNILQGGIGYNVTAGKFYGMVGFNIPLAGFNIDGDKSTAAVPF